jgi:5-methylcytosine-specific restriction enzyme B
VKAYWCGEPIYSAAERVRDSCLRRDGSLFTPGDEVWTRANLSVVEQRIGIADAGGQSSIDKLEVQLTGLDPAVIQLGAELLFVQMISEADTHGQTAREHLARILGLLPQPVALPEGLDQALDAGGVAGFAAGKAYRDAHVRFLARRAAELKNLSIGERDAVLDDPWRFRAVTVDVRTSTDAMEANAVLYLLFPTPFRTWSPKRSGRS